MYLIVGAGLSGCVIAEQIATELKEEVLIIDKREHIAGNIHDYIDKNGVMVHQYGPHAFHTNSEKVWKYLSNFTEWAPYFHHVEAYIDGQEIPVPFNFNSIDKLFPRVYAEKLISDLIDQYGLNKKVTILELLKEDKFKQLAEFIYQKVFLGYTIKQWDKKPEDLDISVSGRVPIYTSRDNRYFQDKYQAIPKDGYTAMVERMINSPFIKLELGRDFKDVDKTKYKKIIYTGMIDQYFDYELGRLPYRSLQFKLNTFDKPYYQATAQKNYSENFDFTRTTEYKYFLDQQTEKTTVAFEYPCAYESGVNEPYYPIPSEENALLYRQYRELASKEKNVVFVGRLATYQYLNMDQVVGAALNKFQKRVK